jgi:enoyl-CoA hydratase/carnithine racemase
MTPLFTADRIDEGIVSLRIATDDESHMDPAWAHRLVEALDALGRDPGVRVVVLEGAARVFCAGASRESLLGAGKGPAPARYAAQVALALQTMPVPVVAAAAGHAIGGGLLVGLWSDAMVLAEESLYGANFMALGFTPGMGATLAVPEAFGPVLGRQLLFTGELLTGRAIRDAGCPLSHLVRQRAQVRDHALAVARDMAAAPREAAALLKHMLFARRQSALEQALDAEEQSHLRLFANDHTLDEIARRYPRRDGSAGAP